MTAPRSPRCRNCHAALPASPAVRFCPQCGQETDLHPPSFLEFVHEFVGHYIALEGPLWRTLTLLLFPGRLTREYLAGRRRRYVLPLRLYLSASFLFFVFVKLLGAGGLNLNFAGAVDEQGRPLTAATSPALAADLTEARRCMADPACPWAPQQGTRLRLKLAETAESPQSARMRLAAWAPFTVFLLLPVFAAIMKLVYRNRGLNYGAHFVFSLHMHSFWFLALLAMSLLPDALTWPILVLTAIYGLWAMQQVYRGRLWATLLRAAAISTVYGAAFMVGMVLLMAAVVLRG